MARVCLSVRLSVRPMDDPISRPFIVSFAPGVQWRDWGSRNAYTRAVSREGEAESDFSINGAGRYQHDGVAFSVLL